MVGAKPSAAHPSPAHGRGAYSEPPRSAWYVTTASRPGVRCRVTSKTRTAGATSPPGHHPARPYRHVPYWFGVTPDPTCARGGGGGGDSEGVGDGRAAALPVRERGDGAELLKYLDH